MIQESGGMYLGKLRGSCACSFPKSNWKKREIPNFERESFSSIGSMYCIFTYIWLNFMVNVGKYTVRPMDPTGQVSCCQDVVRCI